MRFGGVQTFKSDGMAVEGNVSSNLDVTHSKEKESLVSDRGQARRRRDKNP